MVAVVAPAGHRVRQRPERRLRGRGPDTSCAEALRLDHTLAAYRNPRISLSVCDLSDDGMLALSDVSLICGEHLGVSFPSQPQSCGWDRFGRVVRCEPGPLGRYDVAVEFDCLPAA